MHVQPGARRAEVVGTHGDALKVRVTAPPVDGRATTAVAAVLADHFGVPGRDVVLVTGATSRRKRFRVTGLPPARVEALVTGRPASGNTSGLPDVREARRP